MDLQNQHIVFPSSETALEKVFDDILSHIDDAHEVILTLLNLSASLDTVDHKNTSPHLDSISNLQTTHDCDKT